jgi:hypothetical protein
MEEGKEDKGKGKEVAHVPDQVEKTGVDKWSTEEKRKLKDYFVTPQRGFLLRSGAMWVESRE